VEGLLGAHCIIYSFYVIGWAQREKSGLPSRVLSIKTLSELL